MEMRWVQRGIKVMECDGSNDMEMDAFITSTQGCKGLNAKSRGNEADVGKGTMLKREKLHDIWKWNKCAYEFERGERMS